MRLSIQNAILALLPAGALAHNIALGPYSRECFYETLRRNDQMTVTFQVGDREFGSSGAMEVDFWIQEPTGSNYLHERAVSSGDHGFESRHDGRHTYCFSNEHSSASSKEVSFNVHGTVFVSEGESKEPLDVEGI